MIVRGSDGKDAHTVKRMRKEAARNNGKFYVEMIEGRGQTGKQRRTRGGDN